MIQKKNFQSTPEISKRWNKLRDFKQRMDRLVPIHLIVRSIPPSIGDDLLHTWGYDLVAEYIQIIWEAELPPAESVLELATGSGRMSAVLTRLGFSVITGDLSNEEYGRTLERVTPAHSDKLQYLLLDMEKLPFRDHSVRSIVCLNTLHELQNPRTCLSEMIRVHARDGTLVVGDFSETGFTTFHRLHRAVYGNDHTEGFLKMADARSLLANAYHVIREVVTPLNITYIASRNRR